VIMKLKKSVGSSKVTYVSVFRQFKESMGFHNPKVTKTLHCFVIAAFVELLVRLFFIFL